MIRPFITATFQSDNTTNTTANRNVSRSLSLGQERRLQVGRRVVCTSFRCNIHPQKTAETILLSLVYVLQNEMNVEHIICVEMKVNCFYTHTY